MTENTVSTAHTDHVQSLQFLNKYTTQVYRFGHKFDIINTKYDSEQRTMHYTTLLHTDTDDDDTSTLGIPTLITLHFNPEDEPDNTIIVAGNTSSTTDLVSCTDEIFSKITRDAVLPNGMRLSRERVTHIHDECDDLVTKEVTSAIIKHDVYPNHPDAFDIVSLAREAEVSIVYAITTLEETLYPERGGNL